MRIGDTISSNDEPKPLPRIEIDEPTVSIFFHVNNGPFAGREGKYVTSRNISERLEKEILSNVSLQIIPSEKTDVFEVRGRGELQMAVLIETMRREGYEFMVSRPEVIVKEIDGKKSEPMEKVFIDTPEDYVGVITEKLSKRKGKMTNLMNNGFGRATLEFSIPPHASITAINGTPVQSTHAAAPVFHCDPLTLCSKKPLPLPEHCKIVAIVV